MYTVITIKEISLDQIGQFIVEIGFNAEPTKQVKFMNPLNKKLSEDLEWYFESYLREPYMAETKIRRHVEQLREYGEKIFKDTIGSEDIYAKYKSAISTPNGFDGISIEIIAKSSHFEAIHWEALKDPLFEDALSVKGVKVSRRNTIPANLKATAHESPWVNLLIVTARPGEENDVDYRTIQRPLFNVIQRSKLRIKAHILRPGTIEALVRHLDLVGSGHYHIIHFDLHGGVLDYGTLVDAKENGTMIFDAFDLKAKDFQIKDFQIRPMLKDLEPFEGKLPFLFFENSSNPLQNLEMENQKVKMPVRADELAKYMEERQIPICILNACQSAKQENTEEETSLGKVLISRGTQLVLAMRYSVSVTGATILMEKIYDRIFQGDTIEDAIKFGRKELNYLKNREAYLGKIIELEDWILPVVYKSRDVVLPLKKMSVEEKVAYYSKLYKATSFNEPTYGFFGRDLEILKIEKSLLFNNQLLVRGMKGVGKSTFLQYLSWWWEITNYTEGTIYFDVNLKPIHLEAILAKVSEKIFGKKNKYCAGLSPEKALKIQRGEVLEALNSNKFAIILDNIYELEDKEIISFLSQVNGKSLIVFGSVNPETKLAPSTFRDHVFLLGGLDTAAQFQMANAIINKKTEKEMNSLIKENEFDFQHLMNLLMGFPLALELVLPKLRDLSVSELVEQLQEGSLELELSGFRPDFPSD